MTFVFILLPLAYYILNIDPLYVRLIFIWIFYFGYFIGNFSICCPFFAQVFWALIVYEKFHSKYDFKK